MTIDLQLLLAGGGLVVVGFVLGALARRWQSSELREKLESYRSRYEEMCRQAGVPPTIPEQASIHRYRVFKRKNPLAKAVVVYSGDNGAMARRAWETEQLGGEQVVEIWDGKALRGKRVA